MLICITTVKALTPEQRFICMSHNRAKNTGLEMLLHHTLWHHLKQRRIDETLERVAAEIVKNGEAYQTE